MYIGDLNVLEKLDIDKEEKLLKQISHNIIINVRKMIQETTTIKLQIL